MIRHSGLLLAEAILALTVSVILVQGNKIISGVIDEMLSCRQVLFGSFLLQFLIYTVMGTIAAFLQSAAASRYAVAVCTEYRIFDRRIEEWNREALWEQIALVSQNVFLFPTTIAENIGAISVPGFHCGEYPHGKTGGNLGTG